MRDDPTSMTATLQASLDALAAGDLDIRAARATVRSALRAGAGMVDRVFAAMLDATWRMVSSRERSDDLELWYDLATHASALARRVERDDAALQISVLARLLALTARFADRQPLDELLERKHVAELLTALAHHQGEAPRTALLEATQLAESNLSRLLGIVSAHGLVARRRHGKEAYLRLTDQGRQAATAVGVKSADAAPSAASHWWAALDIAVISWTLEGGVAGSNAAFRALARRMGCPAPSTLDRENWNEWLQGAVLDERSAAQSGARDLQLNDALWIRVIEQAPSADGSIAMLFDVSAEHGALQNFHRELSAANQVNATLRAQLAEAKAEIEEGERKLLSFSNSMDRLKGEFVSGTSSLALRLRRWLDGTRTRGRWREEAEEADRQVLALKHAIQHFMAIPGQVRPDLGILKSFDAPKMIIESADIVRTLAGTEFEFSHDGGHTIYGDSPTLQAAIGQALMIYVRDTPAPRYFVKTAVDKNALYFLCVGANHKRARFAHVVDYPFFPDVVSSGDEEIVRAGYGYCRDLAETVGGSLVVGTETRQSGHNWVQMMVPLEQPKVTRRRVVGKGV